MERLRTRARLLAAIRSFLDASGSLEVETPALVLSPGVDAHVDAIHAGDGWLATSPEYHMKRLLADGSGPIHQLCKAWRDGEVGALHEPEFTLLEWYVPGFGDAALMDQTETLYRACANALGAVLPPEAPFERTTFREAFERHAGFDPAEAADRRFGLLLRAAGTRPPRDATREDLEDLVLATVVQPELGRDRPAFVTDWPVERAALAEIRTGRDSDRAPSAARFELYVDGLELCNGYHELRDAAEQRARIAHENGRRTDLGKVPYPVDEDFLAALDSGLPDCAGNALGVDRLQMALTGASTIADVRAFRVALRGGAALGLAAAALLTACPPTTLDDPDSEPDPVWDAFVEVRDEHLRALSVPIADCVVRDDTSWPAFHGCVDWHSAVHATWSLQALGRLLGDEQFDALADETLDAEAVTAELDLLEAGSLDGSELPYGFSWFLALARERDRAGLDDLAPLGSEVAGRLEDHVFGLSAAQIATGVLSPQYGNLSWELLNLHAWAEHVDDEALAVDVEELVRADVLPLADTCPVAAAASNTSDFFPPCLHLARLLVTVLPPGDLTAWRQGLPSELDLPPLESISGAHPAGLNFSRAWGLWSLYETTGDLRFRDSYIDHIETHVAMPEYWADDYFYYSHWVAQFGVYALALGYEPGEVP